MVFFTARYSGLSLSAPIVLDSKFLSERLCPVRLDLHSAGQFSTRFSKCAVVVAVLLSLAAPGNAGASAPDPEGTVGMALNHLMERVDAAMTAAGAANNPAGMEAGRDLALAISSTQNVYEEDLGKQLGGKVPGTLKATVDQLDGAVTELTTMTKDSVLEAATHAEQISNSLPYRPQEPRLAKFTPRFLVPSKEKYLVKVRFNGAFEMGAKPEFFPTLTIQTHAYKPVASSAGEVEYAVPITDLFPVGVTAKQLQFVSGSLKVPWQLATLMGKKHTKKEDNFKLFMPALPSGPGTIKFMAKSTRLEGGVPQRHTSQQYHQCSGRSCGNDDDVNHLWTENPDTNCTVVKGSSSLDATNSNGDWKKELLGDVGDVSYSVSTVHHGTASATVDFQITFMETCGHEVANDVGEDVALTWGDTKTIKAQAGSWRVSLSSFDGTHTEFTETNAANPLLKVTATADAVTLTTPDPSTLVWQ
jgi:hypothetical protein